MISYSLEKSTNFKTVLKQTILSTFSQPSTWIAFAVTTGILILLTIVLPMVVPANVGKNILPQMFYPISLIIIITSVVIVTNGLELHEMTFVLTRPVSRRTYIFAKLFASMVTSSITLLAGILCILISVGVFLTKNNYNVITGNSISWLVVFLPPLLAWFFSITGSIFFRTFIKKDAIISITMVIICLLTYQIYIIISTAIQSKPNLNIGYVLIPSIVFGTFSVVFLYFGHFIFQKMFVKV